MKIELEDLDGLQLPAEIQKELLESYLDKYGKAFDLIIEDPKLRARLEERPAETIVKELGLPIPAEQLKRLEGKKLSQIMSEDFPGFNRMNDVRLGPAATAAVAVSIWAGPLVVAGVYIYAHGYSQRSAKPGDMTS